ncbi:MAG: hypothetical protein MK042_12450 [Cognatishimia sp.]|nr:hypothetical protein [Cognatishimia sp.]
MTRLRSHIAFVLIFVLTLTGHSMAIARGASGPAGFMELCTGAGPVMVAIDEHGEPTGESHICPEFSLMLQNALDGDAPEAQPVAVSVTRICCPSVISLVSVSRLSPSARAPPFLV